MGWQWLRAMWMLRRQGEPMGSEAGRRRGGLLELGKAFGFGFDGQAHLEQQRKPRSPEQNAWPRITGVLALASCPQRPKFTRNPKFAFKPDWDALRTFGSRLESIPVPIA